jgi:hypothetical protein
MEGVCSHSFWFSRLQVKESNFYNQGTDGVTGGRGRGVERGAYAPFKLLKILLLSL